MRSYAHRKSGMARSEWLFIVSLFFLLACLVVPAFFSWKKHHQIRRTYTEIRVLVSAIQQYKKEYKSWPGGDAAKADPRYGFRNANAVIVAALKSNPGQIDFVAMKSVGGVVPAIDQDGNAIDPWKSQYQIVVDGNFDSICTIPDSAYAEITGEEILVWSNGPDRKSDTDDDLRSWIR